MLKKVVIIMGLSLLTIGNAFAIDLEIDSREINFESEISRQESLSLDLSKSLNESREQKVARYINQGGNSQVDVKLISRKK